MYFDTCLKVIFKSQKLSLLEIFNRWSCSHVAIKTFKSNLNWWKIHNSLTSIWIYCLKWNLIHTETLIKQDHLSRNLSSITSCAQQIFHNSLFQSLLCFLNRFKKFFHYCNSNNFFSNNLKTHLQPLETYHSIVSETKTK